jgi:hypothetical protein
MLPFKEGGTIIVPFKEGGSKIGLLKEVWVDKLPLFKEGKVVYADTWFESVILTSFKAIISFFKLRSYSSFFSSYFFKVLKSALLFFSIYYPRKFCNLFHSVF